MDTELDGKADTYCRIGRERIEKEEGIGEVWTESDMYGKSLRIL